MKAHLTILPEPTFRQGEDYEAVCGHIVARAYADFMWVDAILLEEAQVSTLLLCRDCLELVIAAPKSKQRKYIYGLLPGELVKQEMAS